MLLYSTRTAVLKNNEGRSVLLCRITLPTGADDEELGGRILELYKPLYDATCSAAKEYAKGLTTTNGRLVTLNVECEHNVKKGRLTVTRTYTVFNTNKPYKKKVFNDKFKIKYDKTRKYSIKEQ